ncbi:MAG TPA: hypothetical protein VLV50_09065 [Stellaceae bacterium]|nr:hypothetical protein [Stellaceae bacterium]
MCKLLFAAAAVLSLAACAALNSKVVDPLLTDLQKINATAAADLNNAEAVAKAATPPDTDGANCAAAVLTVQGQIAQVMAANDLSNAGMLTAAEVASLFQPGSAQYNQAENTVATGCIAKANDVLSAAKVVAAGGVAAVLPQIIQLAAAAP